MQNIYSKKITPIRQFLTGLILFSLLFSTFPFNAFAQVASSSEPTAEVSGCTDELATNYLPEATLDDGSCEFPPAEEIATTTEEAASSTESVATSTDETASSTDPLPPENDGLDGATGTSTDDVATTTATSTEPTGDSSAPDGTEGDGGAGGTGGSATTTPEIPEDHISEPIPFLSDALIGDEDAPEGEDVTGGVRLRVRNDVDINTGNATAQGEVSTDANSTNLRSVTDLRTFTDLDFYTFNASGTNEANVANDVAALAVTGENRAIAGGQANISSGDAVAVFNIANVINTNIINSDGYLYLANQILEQDTSLNLQDFFFPGGNSVLSEAANCSLNSCVAEDIVYNFSQMNHATITNDAYLEANTGDNYVYADRADIETGDAYGAANVVNVVNTNIIDSNYRLLTFNAVGDLDGDLILPTEEMFEAFFGLPNGLNQLQAGENEDGLLNVDNQNDAVVNNNLDTYAESGLNEATAIDSDITTGNSESESNVLNKLNENVFGGDLMYLWIRIHGGWSGDVVGLPDGLAWEWTPDGIIIYNASAEVTPSEFLGYDLDSYTANITNQNAVAIDNNIHVDAISGRNEVDGGLLGSITTGDTFASANVMNIANTNIIGANWTMAIVNILGDFDGNVTFAQTDLTLIGSVVSSVEPVSPGAELTFSYTVANSSDTIATDVVLTQALSGAKSSGKTVQTLELGDLAPGATRQVQLTAMVNPTTTYGTTDVTAVANVSSDEGDTNQEDNSVITELLSFFADPNDSNDSGTTTATSTDPTDETPDDEDVTPDTGGGSPSPSGGCGGCGGKKSSKTTTKSVERVEVAVDPNAAPFLVVEKEADVKRNVEVKAGELVDYEITVTNKGGKAYDAVVYDVLTNEIGAIINKDSWDLGTVLAGEVIKLEYTTEYDFKTPSGEYTNTASVVAYRNENDKENGAEPLKLDDAVHKIEIVGLPLAVGNVKVVAVFPTGDGTVSALVTWETSKSALGQVYYGPKTPWFQSNEDWFNYGFPQKSFKFSTPKIKHAVIINGLNPGQQYAYRIDADNGQYEYVSREFTFTTPKVVSSLALNVGATFMSAAQILQRVAGVQTTAPVAPRSYVPPAPAPAPTPEPEPVTQVEPEPANTGIVGKVKDTFFGFFR